MDDYTPLSAYKSRVVGEVLSPSILHTDTETGAVSPDWFSAIRKRADFRFRYGNPGKPVYGFQSYWLRRMFGDSWASTPHNVAHPVYLYQSEDGSDSSPSPVAECILSYRNSGRIRCPSLNRLIELEQERLMRFESKVEKLYYRFAKRRYHLGLQRGKKQLRFDQQKEFVPPLYKPKYFDLFAGKPIKDCFPDRKWEMISPNPVYHAKVKGSGLVPISIKWEREDVPEGLETPVAWSGILPLSIRGGITGCPTLSVETYPVVRVAPNRPEKKVPAFDVSPSKVCRALESIAKEFRTEATSMPVAIIELLRDPPNFAAFARNAYQALKAGSKLGFGAVGFVVQLSTSFLRPSTSPIGNLADWLQGAKHLGGGLIRDFNEAARALSGADLERKFSVNDSVRSGLTIFKEGVFTTAGNLHKFRKLLAERGQVKTYHRIVDESSTQTRKTILLRDCAGPSWDRSPFPTNWEASHQHTVTGLDYCRRRALELSPFASRPIGQVVQTVWKEDRLTVCCAWDVFDALGNRYIDDVVANQLGCSALGLSLDPAVIWNLCPLTFLIDWCYNVGRAHSYFYSLSAGRPSFQYYWALVSRKSVTSTRWLPTRLVDTTRHSGVPLPESVVVSSTGTSWTSTEYTRMLIDPESYEGLGADWSLEKPSLAQTVTGLELLTRFLL